jgi:hypothetical protein
MTRESVRERQRGSSSRTGLPGVLDLTTGSGEMQSFNGHLSHFPTLPPLLLGVLQNTFAIAITSSSWSLQNKSPPTTHHYRTTKATTDTQTKPTTQWVGTLSKNSPLTQESERTRQAARSRTKRKIALWRRREYICNSTRHRSIVNTKMLKSKRVRTLISKYRMLFTVAHPQEIRMRTSSTCENS